jgi:hypothetical protein
MFWQKLVDEAQSEWLNPKIWRWVIVGGMIIGIIGILVFSVCLGLIGEVH